MDPLSIAASSAGLVSLCTAISKSLYKFICDSRVVDQALAVFRDEIDELSGFLASIESSFSDRRTGEAALRETTGHERLHWEKAVRGMDNCRKTLEKLSDVLQNVSGDHGRGLLSRHRRQIRLDMNSAEIVLLRQQVQSYKDTMKLSFHVITMYDLFSIKI
jgi:Fungal N-terminal domain of STAND proteins